MVNGAGACLIALGVASGVATVVIENEKIALNCVACHGTSLQGVEGLGVSLVASPFVARKTVPELVAFLKAGRMPDDADSVSGRPMPGFGWLPEADLTEIATFVKNRQGD